MRRVKLYKDEYVDALQDEDLAALAPTFETCRIRWRDDLKASGGDRGTCVLGAGLAIYYVPPRGRKPVLRVIVGSPGQGDCEWCKSGAAEILRFALDKMGLEGVAVGWEYGRMD